VCRRSHRIPYPYPESHRSLRLHLLLGQLLLEVWLQRHHLYDLLLADAEGGKVMQIYLFILYKIW
jgi:hypothetical protein